MALTARGIPADISSSAGTYVGNHVASAMAHLAAARRQLRSGLFHVPHLPQQVARQRGAPGMALPEVRAGLTIALKQAASTVTDHRLAAGTLC